MKAEITVKFLSDWHIGEGVGSSGHIDRIVRRHPQDGLPFVPAKTLTGILRDGCEKVARGLDEGASDGAWQQFLRVLFGEQSKGTDNVATTTAARLSIGPARFQPALRQAFCASPDIKAALTFIKPGVKMDKNGVAQSDMLRMEEVVLQGAELTAELHLELPEDTEPAALALLAAGAKAVERLGGKRRRGHGRCGLRITGAPDGMASILGAAPPDLPPKKNSQDLAFTFPDTTGDTDGWHSVQLDLELLSPVVIPDGTAGNVITTRDHIPGSLLLPALNGKLKGLMEDKAQQFIAHLAAGRIQIRNAYPLRGGQRLLPVPAALMAEKESVGKVICELNGHQADNIQRKQLRSGYTPADFLPETGETENPLGMVKTTAATHAVIDDTVQRPSTAVGGVYTYEAIAPGQRFRAEILISQAVLPQLPELRDFAGEIRIGRAKKDDFGKVRIIASQSEAADRSAISGETLPTTEFTLWLASPLLVRDERLRPITDAQAFTAWLGQRLDKHLHLEKAFVRSLRDDGWNNAWNEPRPTRFGLAAGSCFLFKAEDGIGQAALAKLEAEGLGERRAEGYGEVRVNAAILRHLDPPRAALADSLLPQAPLELQPMPFTHQLNERAWRIGIRRQAMAKAASIADDMGWKAGKPENSQLGALRGLFEQWTDTRRLAGWLIHLKDIANRLDKWPKTSITLLECVAQDENHVWQKIEACDLPVLPGHSRDELKQCMAAEATRTLWLTAIGVELDRRAQAAAQAETEAEEASHGA